MFNVNVRSGSSDSGSAELGTKAALSFIVLNIDLSYGALVSWVMLTAVHYQVEVSVLPLA